jgi:hypothetical protein
MNSNKLIQILGYAGLIPFYFLSLVANLKNYNFLIDIFFIYSVIILCFLSGSLWMKLILLPAKTNDNLLKILSVTFPLIALASELMVTYVLKIIIYITYVYSYEIFFNSKCNYLSFNIAIYNQHQRPLLSFENHLSLINPLIPHLFYLQHKDPRRQKMYKVALSLLQT